MAITKNYRDFKTIRNGLFLLIIALFASCKTSLFVDIKENENAYLIRNNKSIGEVFKENFDSNEIDNSLKRCNELSKIDKSLNTVNNEAN